MSKWAGAQICKRTPPLQVHHHYDYTTVLSRDKSEQLFEMGPVDNLNLVPAAATVITIMKKK